MLVAPGESFRDWKAALIKLLKKRGAPSSFTTEPDPHDALSQNHHRILALVMEKTIDESDMKRDFTNGTCAKLQTAFLSIVSNFGTLGFFFENSSRLLQIF